VTWEDKAIPFARLADLIGAPSPSRGHAPWTALIVEAENGAAAIGVERLQGLGSVVWRPLPDLAPRTPLVTGTILADDGAPQLVLDPVGLVAAARRLSASVGGAAAPAARSLLVIDDSLTTRMLEKSILELAGYHVDTANSAEEGLEQARRQDYALFLVDVEMPGMDGFGFIEEVRRDPAIGRVPALLVTSCSSPEARRRGEEVGAQGYIVKSEFDQIEFLRTVEQLVN
jgi:two-component system chemotaxis sensor kinase CheA